MNSSDSLNSTSDQKKKVGYNPLRPSANPLRPQNQQNSRNTSTVNVGAELDQSTSDKIHNAKTLYNTPSSISVTSTNNDPHKTIYKENKQESKMNQEEVEKLNEDIDQLSKNINDHLKMAHSNYGSTSSISSNRSNPLAPARANPLAPSRAQSQNVLAPSSRAQSQNELAPTPAPSSVPAPAPPAPTPAVQSKPQTPSQPPTQPPAQTNNNPPAPSNSNNNNNNGFDSLDSNTEICVQPTNLNPDRTKPIYCEHCHEKIVGSILSSGKKFYHPRHFLCGGCNCSLNGKPFFEVNDQPLCVNCYNNQHGVKCAFCNEFITGQYITALNQNWHPDHLRCCECNEPIKSIIEEKDGKAYCHNDYQKLFGICCNKCQKPILSGGYITALDKPWHVDCFVCNVCGEPFTSSSFYELDGFPYCSKHYDVASQCDFCKSKIVDHRVKVGDKFFHSNHVFCTCCKNPISNLMKSDKDNINDLFKITDNNVICKNCIASQTL
ncbi:LIM-domain-containing protein [Anaeromyces robustus]|uniref:LIM-domain-containing protein n=1 Tax=Anaeromyces robustus TaxID=1754192 RepID=A0A1Y1XHX8_9FUNG|nr:LIM-domain-containing protein [Anaeromyces robustus]|eukprot:ORX85355.1 LIM-domain-containing protein [Anaeromyces robustus]